MTATHAIDTNTTSSPVLYLAFELGRSSWKLVFTTGPAQKPRIGTIAARDRGNRDERKPGRVRSWQYGTGRNLGQNPDR